MLGPNGAGKTTAISLLLGLLRADAGKVTLFDLDPASLAARRRIGAMLQTAGVPDMLASASLIHLFRSYYPTPRTFADIVDACRRRRPLKRRYGNLSGGQQRRVQFALAIAGNPEILFLDEPTTGLDIDAREDVVENDPHAGRRRLRDRVDDALSRGSRSTGRSRLRSLARPRCRRRRCAANSCARGQRRVSCVSTLDSTAIARMAGCAQRGTRRRSHRDRHRSAENLVRRLLREDATLSELEVHRAGLAEAFVEITKEAA